MFDEDMVQTMDYDTWNSFMTKQLIKHRFAPLSQKEALEFRQSHSLFQE